ncbi:MAG TPA: tetratricopeptide repeat protein [Gammaproteobacteria bacterium]|nr:tetratricopeptide repeat protein [Gammaproteobacteria bacterium]
MLGRFRQWTLHVAPVAVAALALLSFTAAAQEPAADGPAAAPHITLIELTPHLAVNDAAALIEVGKYADAIMLLDEFTANQSQQVPEAFYLLGLAHYQLGDYAKARMPAERAATLAPDAPLSWLELVADILKRSNQPRAAIPWLEKLIDRAPGNKVYWLELSVAYEKVGDFERSLATMRLAQQAGLLTEDGDFRRLSDLLVHQGLPFQGAEVLDQALAAQTVRADEAAYTKLGTAWFMAGETDKAVLPLENAARAAAGGDGYVRLANVHITRQDWPAAVAALHAGMGKGSLTDEAHADLLMGVALYAQGKFDEAREWLTMAANSERHRAMAQSYLDAIDARIASR